MTHVQANMDKRIVSAEDALNCIEPGMSSNAKKRAIHELPRAVYLLAYWPPEKCNEKNCAFKAVRFQNIKLLLDGDVKEMLGAPADNFVADM